MKSSHLTLMGVVSPSHSSNGRSCAYALRNPVLHEPEKRLVAHGRRLHVARRRERKRAAGDGVADIAADHVDFVGVDIDDDIAMAFVIAAVLMVIVDAGLARPADDVADLRLGLVQAPAPESGGGIVLEKIPNGLENIDGVLRRVTKPVSRARGL